ncbi:MAG: MotA/TolQ/ExbB proton channel family protein [Planctomycetota bacterium]
MFHEEFQHGGPVMVLIFLAWVLMLSLILERGVFWAWRLVRRADEDEAGLAERAGVNLDRIDGLSHLATSLGLFGTVLGIARAFFAKGEGLALAAPEVLASGMATALFTTVAGLSVFLVGQASLLVFAWWEDAAVRRLRRRAA